MRQRGGLFFDFYSDFFYLSCCGVIFFVIVMNLILPTLVCEGYKSGKGKKSMLEFLFVCLLTNFHLFLTKL